MSKRANSEGCIRQRADGRWEGIYTIGRKPNGNPDRRSVYGLTQAEVTAKLRDIAAEDFSGRFHQT